MSEQHVCVDCGNTVFTLAAPRDVPYGVRTGIKVLECVPCGSQNQPRLESFSPDGRMKITKPAKSAPLEWDRHSFERALQMLRNHWLMEFNKYAGVNNATYTESESRISELLSRADIMQPYRREYERRSSAWDKPKSNGRSRY